MATEEQLRQQTQQSLIVTQQRQRALEEARRRQEIQRQPEVRQEQRILSPREQAENIILNAQSPSGLSREAKIEYQRIMNDPQQVRAIIKQRGIKGVEFATIGGRSAGLLAGKKTTTSTGKDIPFGYSPRSVVDVYGKYQAQLTPEQRRKSQIEQNRIITENPAYQREIQKIYSQASPSSIQTYEKKAGIGGAFTGSVSRSYTPTTRPSGVISNIPYGQTEGGLFGLAKRKIKEVEARNLIEVTPKGSTYKRYLSQTQKYREYVSGKSFKELYKKGDIPAIVTKGFYAGGEKFLNVIDIGRTKTIGGKPSTPEQIKIGGELIGEVGLWGFFSPYMSVGAVAKQKQIKVSESQFKALEDFYAGVQKELLTKKAGSEQNKYLADLYKKYFSKSEKGKESFKKMVKELYEKDIYKGIPTEFLEKAKKETPILYEITAEIPYMRGAGVTGSIVSTPEQASQQLQGQLSPFSQIAKTQEFDVLGLKDIGKTGGKVKSIQTLWSGQTTKQKTKQTTALGVLSLLRTQQELRTQQRTGQKTGQITKVGLGQVLGLKQTQKQVQKQVLREPTRQKGRERQPKRFRFRLSGDKKKKKITETEFKEMFKVYGRRFGKDKPIAEAETEFLAKRKLKGFLKGGLGRSGFIEKGGQKIDVNLGWGFRPSKTRKKVVVQRAEFSLGTPSEVKEIQFFRRKSKKKGKKRFNWF